MVAIIVLTDTLIVFLMIGLIVGRAIINKQQIIGRPPIPAVFFILAKMFVTVNLVFLLFRGLDIHVDRIFAPVIPVDIIALVFLITGTVILFLSAFKLKNDLVFGLSSSEDQQLQTKGIYSVSRHPFYMGFIFILFSSCLFFPNYINILAFIGAWVIHHFIMIKEEQFLGSRYGDDYRQYSKKVKRYLTL